MRPLIGSILTISLTIVPSVAVAQTIPELWERGLEAANAQNYPQAESIWRLVIENRPQDPGVYNNLGLALMNQGKLDQAIAFFTQAIQLDRTLVAAYNNLGMALAEQNKLNDAGAIYMEAIKLNPNVAPPYTNVGDVLRELDRLEEATSAYTAALSLPEVMGQPASSHTLAHYGLGLLYQEQGKLSEAMTAFQQALVITPNYQPAQASLRQVEAELNPQ